VQPAEKRDSGHKKQQILLAKGRGKMDFFCPLLKKNEKNEKAGGGGETEMMATRPIHSFLLFSNATKD
jgi:hypothetical protein